MTNCRALKPVGTDELSATISPSGCSPDGIVEENEDRRDRAPLSRSSSALTGEEER